MRLVFELCGRRLVVTFGRAEVEDADDGTVLPRVGNTECDLGVVEEAPGADWLEFEPVGFGFASTKGRPWGD